MEKLLGDVGFSVFLRRQDGNRCAQMRGPVVKKPQHERVSFERFLDDAALNAAAAAVYEADLRQPGLVRRVDVVFNHRWDVAWPERVEIEAVFDGYSKRVLILHLIGRGSAFRIGRSLQS
jgi:hypothetical protein